VIRRLACGRRPVVAVVLSFSLDQRPSVTSPRTDSSSEPDPANLEFPGETMRALGEAALARVIEHVNTLSSQPARGDVGVEHLCRSLKEPAPEAGSELAPLLDLLFDTCLPHTYNTAGPGYMAYIPGGGVFPAALADLISDATNRYTGMWAAAPLLVQLEANALDWIRDAMGFPPTTRGLFTTGGSMANFNAIVCAREKRLGPDIREGTVYVSKHVHHSVEKSAKLAGVFPDRIRAIAVDRDFRMRVDQLANAIRSDRAGGLRPFLVVSTAGTTNTGAVDPLDAVADICADEDLWHHVDGAYGAFFHLCETLRQILKGLPRADSLTLDPHKGLFLPYGTGALLVRDGATLRAVYASTASYLPDVPDPDEFYDPSQHGPELSRGFPGLRVWLTVKLFGMARIRAAILEKRELAVEAADQIGKLPGVRMIAAPQLSLFAFHLEAPGASLTRRNSMTRDLLERVIARGRILLTGCEVDGEYLARVCVLSFRTRRAHMETCVRQIAEESAVILSDFENRS
jgi:aromatic-L-amino-acid/L-tryptophan decarboxylase